MNNRKIITEEEVVDGVTYTKKYIGLKNDETNKPDYVRQVLAQNPHMTNGEYLELIAPLKEKD